MPVTTYLRPRAALPLILLTAGLLGGCGEYLDRRETVSFAAGDAMARNRAIHTTDPWPARSFDNRVHSTGAPIENAVTRYRNGQAARAGQAAATRTGGGGVTSR